jgi:hypothetical protein
MLSPNAMSGSDIHPWRLNANPNGSAGNPQNLDLLGVCVTNMEIKLLNRNGNVVDASSLLSFNQPFNMTANTDYWIKLEVEDATHTRLYVYSDATMSNELRNQLFTTPDLDPFNEIYIANCNGNSTTYIVGKLDDYVINKCSVAGIEETKASTANWQMFPNPAATSFEIDGTETIDQIAVYDMKGEKVSVSSVITANHASVDVGTEIVNGIYMVEITTDNGDTYRTRLLKQE